MKTSMIYLVFISFFPSAVYSSEGPRLTLRQESSWHQLIYGRNSCHTVFFLQEGSDNLFIGGVNYVLQVNVSNNHVLENITLIDDRDGSCDKSSCENVVTVIEEFQERILVCGTNGENPRCWKLHPEGSNHYRRGNETIDGTGISTYTYSQNSVCLTADGDLYAAAPLYREGTSLQFRRKTGSQISVWMYDPWITEPTFISAFLARRPEDPIHEKIYVLFREKNPDSNPEADPWISRVARVCRADKGGSKSFFQNIWTSFLKARLVCGIPSESLYFNRLQDVFVLHSENWVDSQVYALFSSSWNSTAVCKYSLSDFDGIFENSSFKGYSGHIPNPRPGTCVGDSRSLPTATITIVKQHPEMTEWIQPIKKDSPFYISSNNYTRIVVDRVQGADGKTYNVVLLATDTGLIHKILEDGSKAFIISETNLCSGAAPVQSMKLSSEKRKLFVGYPGQMSVLDLQRCRDYNASCQDCVLARDPYCAWTENGCTSQDQGGIQNIATGETHVCSEDAGLNKGRRNKRDVSSSSSTVPLKEERTVSRGASNYFSCPIESHHATYYWMHGNHHSPCQQTQSDCLYLIPAVRAEDYGEYTCESKELDYTKTIKKYNLREPAVAQPRSSAVKRSAQRVRLLIASAAVMLTVHLQV